MAQYTAALLDDDRVACKMLSDALHSVFASLHHSVVISSFCEADRLKEHLLQTHRPDFLFLDIELGTDDGIALGKELRSMNYDGLILYVSSHSEHVFSSLQISPFRFLRKSRLAAELPEAISAGLRVLAGKSGQKVVLHGVKSSLQLDVGKLLYIEAHNRTLEIVSTSGTLTFDYRMMDAEQLLAPYGFLRVHKGYLVNAHRISLLEKGSVLLEGDIRIPVSKYRQADVEAGFLKVLRQTALEGGAAL